MSTDKKFNPLSKEWLMGLAGSSEEEEESEEESE